MIRLDEDALICDLAETYHIYNYKSLPAITVATLASGLRDDSRIKLKQNKQRVSNTDLLLAVIADRLGLILSGLSGVPVNEFFVDGVFEDVKIPKKKSNVMQFSSAEEFEKARAKYIKQET